MKNLLFLFFIGCGAFNRFSAQDTTTSRPWDYIVDFYAKRLQTIEPLLKRNAQGPANISLEEEKIFFVQKNKLLLKIKFDQELIRRKDDASIYKVRGGNWDYDFSYEMYIENIFDSLLTSMIPRDAEGRIKNSEPATTFVFATTGNNCQQSLSLPMINDSLFTFLVLEKPALKKVNQKPKTNSTEKVNESTQKKLSEITTVMAFPLICSDVKTESLKNKLKGKWCNHFYKDEKGKEMWKLFPSAGLMGGCSGIEFFENDSCREYISGMVFGGFSKRKTKFFIQGEVLTFAIKTSEGKTEYERYKIIKADETEILLEKIVDEIKTSVPFLMIEPDHCHNGGMGDCGVKK